MLKRYLRIVSVLFVFVFILTFVFAGCGTSTGGSKSTDEITTGATTAATAAATENKLPLMGDNLKYDPNAPVNDGKDITIKFWDQVGEDTYYNKWTQEYSKLHPNVKFDMTSSSFDDLFKKLPIALQSGTGPDCFYMSNEQEQALLSNMEPYPEDIFPLDQMKADFIQIDEHLKDGKLYYLDMGSMTGGIFYNKKLWAEAGLTDNDIPKTWEQFREIAKKLTKTDSSGNITVAGFNFNTGFEHVMNAMAMQQGNFLFDKEGKKPLLNTPENIKDAKFIYDLYNVDKVGSIKLPPSHESFGAETAAMIYSWGWIGGYLRDNFPKVEYGFFPSPTFDGKVPPAYERNNGESTPGVSAKANEANKKVSFDFIKYLLANDDAVIDYALYKMEAPSKKFVANRPEITGNIALAGQTGILDRTFWPGPVPGAYFNGLITYVSDEIMINNVPPEKALAKAEEVISKDMEPSGFVSIERKYQHADEFKN